MLIGIINIFPLDKKGFSHLRKEGSILVMNEFAYEFRKTKNNFHYFLPEENLSNVKKIGSSFRVFSRKKLESNIRKEDYDAFFIPGIFNKDVYSLRKKLNKDFPIHSFIHSQHDLSHLKFIEELSGYIRTNDRIVCSSSCGREVTYKLFSLVNKEMSLEVKKNNLRIISFGTDIKKFRVRNQISSKIKLSLPKDKNIILFIGRLSPFTKADLFPVLRIIKHIFSKKKDWIFLICGQNKDFDYKTSLLRFSRQLGIENRVIVKTDVSEEEKPFVYNASDIFISPSDNIQETFGLTILEAMSSGLPVLCSDWNGYKETVHKDSFRTPTFWYSGFEDKEEKSLDDYHNKMSYYSQLVCVDTYAMEKKLEVLMKNSSLRREIGSVNRKIVLEKYRWKNIIKLHQEMLRESISIKGKEYSYLLRKIEKYPYFKVFQDYPSVDLARKKDVTIHSRQQYGFDVKSYWQEYYKGKEFLNLNSYLDIDIINEIYSYCKEKKHLKEVLAHFRKASSVDEMTTIANILWMSKHVLLTLKKQ